MIAFERAKRESCGKVQFCCKFENVRNCKKNMHKRTMMNME